MKYYKATILKFSQSKTIVLNTGPFILKNSRMYLFSSQPTSCAARDALCQLLRPAPSEIEATGALPPAADGAELE